MVNTTMNATSAIVGDNQESLIILVNLLSKTISQYGLGFIMIMGNIGAVLTAVVFSQPAFQKSPCAMHFVAAGCTQFFTMNFGLLTRMLQYGYGLQAVNNDLWYCKIRFYLFYIFVNIPRYNIIMASVDRYFASSRDARRRQWSSPKIARRLIIANICFWCVVCSQVIIFYEISNGTCQARQGAYGIFFSFYLSFDSGILPLLLMAVFGLLTVRNVHQTKKRIEPGAGANADHSASVSRMSKKDAHLHRMLANQICLFIILNLPNPCYLVYHSFTLYAVKSPFRNAAETFISNMTYILIYLGFSLTFATFAISSDIFRREFRRVIQTKVLRRSARRGVTEEGTTVRTLRPNEEHE